MSATDSQRVLAAIFRTDIEHLNKQLTPNAQFAGMLKYLGSLIRDGWGASDAQYPQAVFDEHGPATILRALADAYDAPEHVLVDEGAE